MSSELNMCFFCQSQQCITKSLGHYTTIWCNYINRQMFPLIRTNNSTTNDCSPHCLVIGGILFVYEVLHVQLYDACTWIAHEKIMCSQWTTLFFSTLIPPTLGDFTLLVSNPSGGLETAIGTPSEGLPRCFPRAELKCSLINLSTLCRCWFQPRPFYAPSHTSSSDDLSHGGFWCSLCNPRRQIQSSSYLTYWAFRPDSCQILLFLRLLKVEISKGGAGFLSSSCL